MTRPGDTNTLRKQDMWGCCYLCDLRQGWKVKLERSPIWPHPISCPRCHQTWRDTDEFNAAAKEAVARFMEANWDTVPDDDVTPEDRKWQSEMDDYLGERMEKLRKQNWSPYEREEDKPVRIIVPDWGGEKPDQGSVDPASGGTGQVRVDGGRDGRGDSGGQGSGPAGGHAPDAGGDTEA